MNRDTVAHSALEPSASSPGRVPHSPEVRCDALQSTLNTTTIPSATAMRRRRGPSLSRRIGQSGSVFQHRKPWNPTAPAYGRYWVDVPGGGRKRQTISLGLCKTLSVARKKLRDYIDREGINASAQFTANTSPAVTFRSQAVTWLQAMSMRRRKPIKPATLWGWQHALDKWLLPNLGDLYLSDVGNAAMKQLIGKMSDARLSAQSIVNYTKPVKMIVASAVDADGEQIYPRKWNHDFIGMPIVEREKQRRPTLTESEVEEILAKAKGRWHVLFALLAGTGLRIGEALGLKTTDLSPDGRVLHVSRSIWRNHEQEPKTPAAVREVDIAEPMADLLREYSRGKSGYLFSAKSGRPLQRRNVHRVLHATGKKVGLHSFRRFRTETLRRKRAPEDLIKLWLGHAKSTVTDFYATGLAKDLAWRREWSDRVGLGFDLGHIGLQNLPEIETATTA
jgi:integrase